MSLERDALRSALLASTSALGAIAAMIATAPLAVAQTVLPTHGVVASGAASIGRTGANMTIEQTSPRAIINWNSFSIGAGNGVTFVQPNASAAVLNRVTGATTSAIAGKLDATGQVYLVNPNGIAITSSGAVRVGGGFVASTLGISDSNFNSGKLDFTGNGASAAVSNAGSITTAVGGFVGLLGGSVSNSGTISVPLGKVALGSGEQATLDLTGDGFLQVALPTDATTANGQALVDISGAVRAAGGSVAIKAATAANAIRNAVNLSGVVSARSAYASGGSIVLDGGAGGNVAATGALNASGRKSGGSVLVSGRNVALTHAKIAARGGAGTGGSIAVTAADAVTLAGATIDASGATGGGTIAVGGDSRGVGPLGDAAATSIDAGTVLRADALANGNGGSITVWSNGATSVAGNLSARGGASSGNGGSVETSGATVDLMGAVVSTSAPNGLTGSWLIDPTDFTVAASGGDMTGAALSSELGATSVKILSSSGAKSGNGDINIDDKVSWSSANTLTLDAYRDININAAMTVSGAGGVSLIYGDTTGPGAGSGGYGFGLGAAGFAGSLSYPGSGGTLSINGVPYKVVLSVADLDAGTSGDYALGLSVTLPASFRPPASPVPIFYGVAEGLGHTITDLVLSGSGAATGLFGALGSSAKPTGIIRDLGLIGGSVAGGSGTTVGALVGVNYGTVLNSFATSAVSGSASVGGLVGVNYGTIEYSYAAGTVSGSGASAVGGLVGLNSGGTVTESYATGAVSGEVAVGGLVGVNSAGDVTAGTVEDSYATGTVTGTGNVGGLVGYNYQPYFDVGAVVENSYATGAVSGSGAGNVGGLIGFNSGTLESSYAIGAVSGSGNIGGLVGFNSGSIDSSYATGAVSGTGALGGLVGTNAAPTPSPTPIAGGTVTDSYWDTETTGQSGSSGGGTGLTTAQLQGTAPLPAGVAFSLGSAFSGGAAGGETGVYPYLTSFFPFGVQAVSGIAYTNSAGTTPLASGANGAAMVSADVDGVSLPAATTGANGYYYIFAPAGAIPSGADVLVYTRASAATGATNAATYFVSSGANNSGGNNIYGSTLTETTPDTLYSELSGAVTSAEGSDSGAIAAVAGVSNISIVATGASFTVDQAISTPDTLTIEATSAAAPLTISDPIAVSGAGGLSLSTNGGALTIGGAISTTAGAISVTGPTTLDADVTTTGGAIAFDGAVTLGAPVTIDSGGGATTFASTVDGDQTLTVSGGSVNFDANLGASTPLGGLVVSGPVDLDGSVTTNNGAITFNSPVLLSVDAALNSGTATTTFGSTVDSAAGDCHCGLTASAGAFSFGGALGGINSLGAVSLTSTTGMTLPSITATTIFARTTGSTADLTLAPGTTLTASGSGTAVTLAAGRNFINDSGPAAIQFPTPTPTPAPRWLIYSADPAGDVFGGLASGNGSIFGTNYGGAVPSAGTYYVFANQAPTSLLDGDSPSVVADKASSVVEVPQEFKACGVGIEMPAIAANSDPVEAVKAISATTARFVERCHDASPADIADALDAYAAALEMVAPRLAPALRNLPAVVRSAANRARAAPTRMAAVRILKGAVAEVHREIMLVRADDPDSLRQRDAVGGAVSSVLNSAALSLARAEGI